MRLCYMRAEKEAVSLCRRGPSFQRMCGLLKLSNNILMISKPFVERSIKSLVRCLNTVFTSLETFHISPDAQSWHSVLVHWYIVSAMIQQSWTNGYLQELYYF